MPADELGSNRNVIQMYVFFNHGGVMFEFSSSHEEGYAQL